MNTIANDIDLDPLPQDSATGQPLLGSALPFLGAVNVSVEVRIGSTTVSLAQLVEMKQGAVFALDRAVEQPVDVMVGEHVVARGALVAVGDHFGVRISETSTFAAAHRSVAV
jgi:flagellar motor switch protein FliN